MHEGPMENPLWPPPRFGEDETPASPITTPHPTRSAPSRTVDTMSMLGFLKGEHINAQSLQSHFVEVKLLVRERNIDVLCVSETWLLLHTPDEYVNIPNYKIFRCDNGRGAGACMFVNDSLNPIPVVLDNLKQPGVEDVWVTVQCKKWPSIIIGCIYWDPKAPATSFDYIQDTFRTVSLRKKNVLILGDHNDDLLSNNSKLSRILKNNKLTQVIDKPTRVTPTSAILLDVTITNKNYIITTHDVIPHVITDLISVTVNVTKPKRQPVKRTFRHLGGYCKLKLCSLLLENSHYINKILFTDDVNKQVGLFT